MLYCSKSPYAILCKGNCGKAVSFFLLLLLKHLNQISNIWIPLKYINCSVVHLLLVKIRYAMHNHCSAQPNGKSWTLHYTPPSQPPEIFKALLNELGNWNLGCNLVWIKLKDLCQKMGEGPKNFIFLSQYGVWTHTMYNTYQREGCFLPLKCEEKVLQHTCGIEHYTTHHLPNHHTNV